MQISAEIILFLNRAGAKWLTVQRDQEHYMGHLWNRRILIDNNKRKFMTIWWRIKVAMYQSRVAGLVAVMKHL